MQPITTPNIGL